MHSLSTHILLWKEETIGQRYVGNSTRKLPTTDTAIDRNSVDHLVEKRNRFAKVETIYHRLVSARSEHNSVAAWLAAFDVRFLPLDFRDRR